MSITSAQFFEKDGAINASVMIKDEGVLLERLHERLEDKHFVVDFDETLFLKNSTELFLDFAAKFYPFALMLQILDFIKPWRFLSKDSNVAFACREVIRIRLALIFVPWAKKQWQREAPVTAKTGLNRKLYNGLKSSGKPVYIVSFGYDFIIQPLMDEINPDWPLLLSSNFDNAITNRETGKANLLRAKQEINFNNAICISDSLADLDILTVCSESYLIVWEETEHVRAGITPMLPFLYLKKVKRPTEKYFTRAILGHDFLLLVLVFALYSPNILMEIIALFFYMMAYFTSYEAGYYENDRYGILYEEKPKISKEFHLYGHGFREWHSWFCSMIFNAIATDITIKYKLTWWFESESLDAFAQGSYTIQFFSLFSAFLVLQICVRLVFHWFNSIPERGRIIPMLILQVARGGGYLLLFSTNVVGVLYIATHAVAKWIPYVIYRYGGLKGDIPYHLINALLLFILVAMFGVNGLLGNSLTELVTVAIAAYVLLRTYTHIKKFGKNLRFNKAS